MSVIVDSKELKRSVEFIRKFADEHIKILLQEGNIQIIGYNGTWAVSHIDAQGSSDGKEVVVNLKSFQKALKLLEKGSVKLSVEKSVKVKDDIEIRREYLILEQGDTKVQLDTQYYDIPSTPKDEILGSAVFSGDEFVKLYRVVFAAAKMPDRVDILNILVRYIGGSYLTFVATDGYRLSKQVLEASAVRPLEQGMEWKVPAVDLEDVLSVISADAGVAMSLMGDPKKGTYTVIMIGGYDIYIPNYRGSWPRYEGLLEEVSRGKIWVRCSMSDLEKIVDRIVKVGNRLNQAVMYIRPDGKTIIATTNEDDMLVRFKMTCLVENLDHDMVIGFNAGYIRDMLRALKRTGFSGNDRRIHMQISNPRSGAGFLPEGDGSYVYVLMPLNIKESYWLERLSEEVEHV